MRSTRSSGISGIVDAVRGEGRTGRVGLVSILKDRINDSESGMGAPFALNGELGPPRFRRMLIYEFVSNICSPPNLISICHGLSAVEPCGLPDERPGLQIEFEMCIGRFELPCGCKRVRGLFAAEAVELVRFGGEVCTSENSKIGFVLCSQFPTR